MELMEILENLSAELTSPYRKGYTKPKLYFSFQFYNSFPEIFHTVSGIFLKNLFGEG